MIALEPMGRIGKPENVATSFCFCAPTKLRTLQDFRCQWMAVTSRNSKCGSNIP
jgi:hypothetical protein